MKSARSGTYIKQTGGFRAFIPNDLPLTPPLHHDPPFQVLLSEADRAIGRLDASTELLPNPDLFVAMYVRREALYSSQIEGVTQASLDDLLEFEARVTQTGQYQDVAEVVSYVRAMNYGLDRLESLPMSLRLIREIHAKLLEGVRGGRKDLGEFRSSQNWIGPPGCSISEASFVPPPPQVAKSAMGALEIFFHSEDPIPPLIKCALAHSQFESIHPFLDGNGRVGRLLIAFQLCWQGILKQPLLYISDYFKRHRDQYYRCLQQVREEDNWEGWVEFFLEGVKVVALDATERARMILALREQHRGLIGEHIGSSHAQVLLDRLFQRPVISVKAVVEVIDRSYPTANQLVADFESLGLLEETTGQYRNRLYSYEPYRALLR